MAANRVEEAIVHYQRAIQTHPDEMVLFLNQAALFRDTGRYASAERLDRLDDKKFDF